MAQLLKSFEPTLSQVSIICFSDMLYLKGRNYCGRISCGRKVCGIKDCEFSRNSQSFVPQFMENVCNSQSFVPQFMENVLFRNFCIRRTRIYKIFVVNYLNFMISFLKIAILSSAISRLGGRFAIFNSAIQDFFDH